MSPSPLTDQQRRTRRLIIALTAAGLILLALAGIGIYGLITGPRNDRTTSDSESPSSSSEQPGETEPASSKLDPLPRTTDPEEYALAVSVALFDWDTFTLLTPSDHQAVLIEDADPAGIETPGLIADLDNYFPSSQTWRDLSEYRTTQHITVDRIYVPEQWEEAVAAGGDQIAEGTIAYTIEGTRHREGVWYDETVTSEHRVAFTVFLACEPQYERCHLLRLSELDNPLH